MVLFVAFNVDDVGNVTGHETSGTLRLIVDAEILVEHWMRCVGFGNLLAFELLQQPRSEKRRPKFTLAHLGHVLIICSTDDSVLVEDELNLLLAERKSGLTVLCSRFHTR